MKTEFARKAAPKRLNSGSPLAFGVLLPPAQPALLVLEPPVPENNNHRDEVTNRPAIGDPKKGHVREVLESEGPGEQAYRDLPNRKCRSPLICIGNRATIYLGTTM